MLVICGLQAYEIVSSSSESFPSLRYIPVSVFTTLFLNSFKHVFNDGFIYSLILFVVIFALKWISFKFYCLVMPQLVGKVKFLFDVFNMSLFVAQLT